VFLLCSWMSYYFIRLTFISNNKKFIIIKEALLDSFVLVYSKSMICLIKPHLLSTLVVLITNKMTILCYGEHSQRDELLIFSWSGSNIRNVIKSTLMMLHLTFYLSCLVSCGHPLSIWLVHIKSQAGIFILCYGVYVPTYSQEYSALFCSLS
jgi:hypothetical protein